MKKREIQYVLHEIKNKIAKEELISTTLLTKNLFFKYGLRINKDELETYLIKNDDIVKISKGIFIPFKAISKFNGDKEKIIDYLKNKFFIQLPDLSDLPNKIIKEKDDTNKFIVCNNANSDIPKINENNLNTLYEKQTILERVIKYFEDYYKENKRAIDINRNFLNSFQGVSEERILECLQNEKIFYQLTKKRYGLCKWMIDDLNEYFKRNSNPIDIISLEERARKVFGVHFVNRKNLKRFFLRGKKRIDKILFLEIKANLNTSLDNVEKQCNEYKQINKKITLERLLDTPKTIDEILLNLRNEYDTSKVKKLELVLSTLPNVIIDERNRYKFLINGEKEPLHSLINKIYIKHLYIISQYTIDELIEKIMRKRQMPIKEKELICKINCILKVDGKQIINILRNDERFIRTGHNEWFLKEISKYPEFKGDFIKTLNELVEKIGKRNWDIYMEYTLKNETTLQTIGHKFNLTRERVRQINKKVERKLSKRENKSLLLPYIDYFHKIVFNGNRIVKLENIGHKKIYYNVFANIDVRKLVRFFNRLDHERKITIYNDEFLINMDENGINNLISLFNRRFIKNHLVCIPLQEAYDFFYWFNLKDRAFINKFIRDKFNAYLFNKSNAIIIKDDSKISRSDIVWFILNENGKPMHYSEIARRFEELTGENSIKDRNILSLLARTPGVIRVFSGLFALKEWGVIQHRHTKDWNYKVLKEHGRPMHYTEIYREVSKYTLSKENTIYANLNTDNRVFSYSNGYYGLREWINDRDKVEKFNISEDLFEQSARTSMLINTFTNSYGCYTSKYYLTDNAIRSGYLKIPIEIRKSLKNQLYLLDYYNNKYTITFSNKTYNIYRLTSIFREKGLKSNQLVYLEFISDSILRFFTESEFDKYKEPDMDIINELSILEDSKFEKSINRTSISTPKDIKEFGLLYGYVYYEDVKKIAHLIDDINDLLDELIDMGIVLKEE